jgi:hypothetical protein
MSLPCSRANTPAKKSPGKVAPPVQKVILVLVCRPANPLSQKAKLDPIASTSKPTPAKGPATVLRPLLPVNYLKDLEPSDEGSDDQTASGTRRSAGRASKKQERLKQKEWEHKAVRSFHYPFQRPLTQPRLRPSSTPSLPNYASPP